MKRMLIVCLLGMGLLLPSTNITAKESSKRIIDVLMDGDWIDVTSDDQTGSLTMLRIYTSGGAKAGQQSCSGYSCSINVGNLPEGSYTLQVTTTLTVYYENFSI